MSKYNIFDYIENDYEWIYKCEGPAFRTDIIRLLLLQKYGGVYLDAACLCCINIDKFIEKINFDRFFAFDIKNYIEKYDGRTLASWFYISTPNNDIINAFTTNFIQAAKYNPVYHPYLLHHYTISDVINKQTNIQKWYHSLYKISAFQNRIDAKILHLNIKTKLHYPEWSHPLHVEDKIKTNSFYIIKLRHKNIKAEHELLKYDTIFFHLYNYSKLTSSS